MSTKRLIGVILVVLTMMCSGCSDLPEVPDFDALGLADSPLAVQRQVLKVYENWQQEPLDADRNGRLGMHLLVYGKDAAAQAMFRRARALAPAKFRWTYYLAFTLRQRGSIDEATQMFREALTIDPGHAEARLHLAELLLQSNEIDESLALYQSITVDFPGRVEGWFGLGKTYVRADDLDAAAASLRRARIMGPQYGDIRYALALVFRQLGDQEGAAGEFAGYERTVDNKVVIADPLMAAVSALHAGDEPHLLRGNRQLGQAQFEYQYRSAAKSFRTALAINPDNAEAWIGLITAQAALSNLEAAGDTYRKAVAAGITYARLHLTYGRILLNREQFGGARDAIGKAIALDPQYAEAFAAMGELEMQSAAPAAAVEQYRLSLAARPNDRQVQLSLAQAMNVAGQFDSAANQLEQLANDPELDKSMMLKELAVAYHGLNRQDEAIDNLQRAREAASSSANRAMVDTIDALLAEWQN